MSGDERRTLVASFGFDIDFVVRRMSREKFDKVVLVSLYTSREAYRRVEEAYHTLSRLCIAMNIVCELERVTPGEIFNSTYSILVKETSQTNSVELFLTGGPRLLVVSLLLSLLSLPEKLLKKTKIIVEGEGFEWTIEINPETYVKRLKLDEISKEIINQLDNKPQHLGELARALDRPKSSIHKKLRELASLNLITIEHNSYRSIPPFKILQK